MMAASHLVSAARWIAGVITEKVITSKLKEWVSQFSGLGGDVDDLKAQMSYVKTVLSMTEGRRIRNTHLTNLLARLHQLIHEADDVLDELDYHRIRQEAETAATTNMVSVPSAAATATSYALHLLSDVASHHPLVSPTFREVLMYPWGRRKRRKLANPTANASSPAQSWVELDKSSLSRRIRQVTIQLRDVGDQVWKTLQLEDLESIGPTSGSRLENPRLTSSYPAGEQKMFGRNGQKESIIDVLTDTKCCSQSRLLVLPIVGNGGMGKTTLLQHVYHNQRVRSFFQIKMWIWIPRCHKFDVVRLTREMLLEAAHATGEKENKGSKNLNSLQANLVKRLQGKRFLVVFDDLWDVEKNKWEVLLAPLEWIKATSNCTILVTTRDRRVAELIRTAPPINLSGLKGEAFWDCFRAYIFGDEKHDGHQHLKDIGRQIASKLNGYPLAAKSVGALLRKDLSIEHWNRVLESREWEAKDGTDGIISILRLSYDDLPFHLKRCFSYCSLFPKSYQFQEKDLVFIWVSQGFVDTGCDRKPEEVGREYLNDLVSLGFFQKMVNPANCHTCYLMHDIIHDLAINVSSDYCLIIDSFSTLNMQSSATIRHLSIITDNIHHGDISRNVPRNENIENIVTKIASSMQMRYLRSLMLFGKYDSNFARVFRRAFREATNMRSIIMRIIPYHEGSLLHDLGQCIHLRYIKIIADDHVQFPEALNGLYHLQVLDVGGTTGDLSGNVYNVYSGASTQTRLAKPGVLTSLHCLYLNNCTGCKNFPAFSQFPALKKLHLIGMPAVTDLQTASLEEVILSDMTALETWTVTEKHQLIDDLKVLDICDCPKLGNLPLPPSDEVNYRQFQRLVIKNCSCLMVLPPLPLDPKSNLSIEDVQSFPCRIISYRADTNPSLLLKGKDELRVLDGRVLSFRNLLYLQELSIDGCPSLTSISWEGFHQFRILKDLNIYRCPNLLSMPITETEQQLAKGLLPSLQRLEIWSCGITGKNLSCLLSNLPHLSFLKLKECRQIRRLAVDQQADQGSAILLPDGAVDDGLLHIKPQSLTSLQELCFDSCPTVCENVEGLKGLVTLKILEILACPRFLSYLVFQNEDMNHIEGTCLLPSSLRELKIDQAEWKLMSLHGLTAIERLSISYSELEALDLESCMGLKYIHVICCPALSTLQGLKSCLQLRGLEIFFSPVFWRAWDLALQRDGASDELSFPVEFVRTSDSSILTLSICKHLKQLWRLEFRCLSDKLVMEQEKALEQLISLNELQFFECDCDFSIPAELQQLTSLKKLELMSCSTTSLFPERGLPPALEHLVIVDCKYLESLPAGMHGHSFLKNLEIKSCPQIRSLPRGGLPGSLQELKFENCSSKLQEELQRMNTAGMVILWS
ncbi:putative disease resistance protein At3g14460 [Phragmites australis]|uniref:putative disease resistance protein At3g14460 n=1 Tax=Phragmites australis TaxID=29695 RepID=UPI002D796586|nr:putative disease resistance protein At3g14460 [Phragmites australis]XP_062210722.1 putative disease resistance protein At3g14460 [Phragmites australis]